MFGHLPIPSTTGAVLYSLDTIPPHIAAWHTRLALLTHLLPCAPSSATLYSSLPLFMGMGLDHHLYPHHLHYRATFPLAFHFPATFTCPLLPYYPHAMGSQWTACSHPPPSQTCHVGEASTPCCLPCLSLTSLENAHGDMMPLPP